MKLMTLNIWGGQIYGPLLEFIANHQDVDVFCFQEVYHQSESKVCTDDSPVRLNIFSEIQSQLLGHDAFFRPAVKNYGIALFVKKGIDIVEEGEVCIYDNPNYPGLGPAHSRILQWVKCRNKTQEFHVMNVHGLWNGKGKTDSPERIVQSQKIREFVDTLKTPRILCGDFNLRPDTHSLKILSEKMQDLIQTYKITSTRTGLYPKQEKFADYIFASPDIAVNSFEVLPHEVSDHSPLLLDFTLGL